MDKLRRTRSDSFTANKLRASIALLFAFCFTVGALQAQSAAISATNDNELAIAVDGDYAVVGAWWHDNFSGAAYIWQRVNGRWIEQQKLSAVDLGSTTSAWRSRFRVTRFWLVPPGRMFYAGRCTFSSATR